MHYKNFPDRNHQRFLRIGLLTEATPVLGLTAGAWDRVIKGNLTNTLLDVRQRVWRYAQKEWERHRIDPGCPAQY